MGEVLNNFLLFCLLGGATHSEVLIKAHLVSKSSFSV